MGGCFTKFITKDLNEAFRQLRYWIEHSESYLNLHLYGAAIEYDTVRGEFTVYAYLTK